MRRTALGVGIVILAGGVLTAASAIGAPAPATGPRADFGRYLKRGDVIRAARALEQGLEEGANQKWTGAARTQLVTLLKQSTPQKVRAALSAGEAGNAYAQILVAQKYLGPEALSVEKGRAEAALERRLSAVRLDVKQESGTPEAEAARGVVASELVRGSNVSNDYNAHVVVAVRITDASYSVDRGSREIQGEYSAGYENVENPRWVEFQRHRDDYLQRNNNALSALLTAAAAPPQFLQVEVKKDYRYELHVDRIASSLAAEIQVRFGTGETAPILFSDSVGETLDREFEYHDGYAPAGISPKRATVPSRSEIFRTMASGLREKTIGRSGSARQWLGELLYDHLVQSGGASPKELLEGAMTLRVAGLHTDWVDDWLQRGY